MKKPITVLAIALAAALVAALPASAGWNPFDKNKAEDEKNVSAKVAETIAAFKNKDPGLKAYFKKAKGYAVFPTVGKGGMVIGGAYGDGEVYKAGKLVGTATLTQVSVGFQLGGQAYSEVIFFGTQRALNDFMKGEYELGAQASAVAVTAGASADADYDGGVAVFTMAKGGLMYEASVGGQKFTFTPK